jgi:peptidoglycan-associated lipoprotein
MKSFRSLAAVPCARAPSFGRFAAAVCAAASTAIACGSDPKPPPTAPAGGTDESTVTTLPEKQAPPPEKAGDDPNRSQIRISDEIKKACGITDAEAFFDFDSANVLERDHSVLGKLARCFTDGALAGREMRLVGHADPRGEPEYNLVLGGRRADNVKGFLAQKGLAHKQMQSTSRGELDATGTDEASWAKDRRVDILLAE